MSFSFNMERKVKIILINKISHNTNRIEIALIEELIFNEIIITIVINIKNNIVILYALCNSFVSCMIRDILLKKLSCVKNFT